MLQLGYNPDKMLPKSLAHLELEHPIMTQRTRDFEVRWQTTSGQRSTLKKLHNRRSRRWAKQVIRESWI